VPDGGTIGGDGYRCKIGEQHVATADIVDAHTLLCPLPADLSEGQYVVEILMGETVLLATDDLTLTVVSTPRLVAAKTHFVGPLEGG